jgi:hypothetical protein
MPQRRAAGSRSTHLQGIDVRWKKTTAIAARAQRILPPTARRGRAADGGAGKSLASLSAASADFTPSGDRSRIPAAVGSVISLQILPQTAAACRDFVYRLADRAFLLRRAVAVQRCGVLFELSVRRPGSGFDSKRRHGHLLRRNLDARGPIILDAGRRALCALAQVAAGRPRGS